MPRASSASPRGAAKDVRRASAIFSSPRAGAHRLDLVENGSTMRDAVEFTVR